MAASAQIPVLIVECEGENDSTILTEIPLDEINGPFTTFGTASTKDNTYTQCSAGIPEDLTDLSNTFRLPNTNPSSYLLFQSKLMSDAFKDFPHGIIISTNPNPTLDDEDAIIINKLTADAALFYYKTEVTEAAGYYNVNGYDTEPDLKFKTTYYYRSYVDIANSNLTNEKQPCYSEVGTFFTAPPLQYEQNIHAVPQVFETTDGVYVAPHFNAFAQDRIREVFGNTDDATKSYLSRLWVEKVLKPEMLTEAIAEKVIEGTFYPIEIENVDNIVDLVSANQSFYHEADSSIVNFDVDSRGNNLYTKSCSLVMVEIPDYQFLTTIPSSSSVNPQIGFDLSNTMLPGKTYNVTIRFAPSQDEENPRGNRVCLYMYNGDGINEATYSTKSIRLTAPAEEAYADGNNMISYADQVTTVTVPYTPEFYTPNHLLLVQSMITSKQTTTYDRRIRIIDIKVEPAE